VPYTGAYPNREPGKRPWNRFNFSNCNFVNVLSMTVDLTRPEGMDAFWRLISKCDALVENNPPETMDKLGITYEKMKEVKPDIIMLRCSGWGLSGPWSRFRGYGSHMERYAGHDMLRGYTDMDATSLSQSYACDHAAGAHGAFAILSALEYRNRTGKGQLIEMSMTETFLPWMAQAQLDYQMNGRIQGTLGNRYPGAAPCGAYRCKGVSLAYFTKGMEIDCGRYVAITCHNDEEWQGLCRAMGNPPWAKKEKFADAISRYNNQDELDRHIEEWTRGRDPFEVMYILQAEGVPAGPVEDYRDAYNDQHLRARGFFEWATQEDCGTHLYPGAPWKMSKTPLRIRRGPVMLGQDNEYIYKQVIGVSDEEYAKLEADGHIGMDYDPSVP
jgi:crotonobetainyl-CoA:carnitine CoA-transferase CaiB-like acyl-CoA transferase